MLGKRWQGYGFKGLGLLYGTKFDVFFLSFFRSPFGCVFSSLERPSSSFWIHSGCIFRSNALTFLHKSFFEQHAFRLHEIILSEVSDGSISVLFRDICKSLCQASIFFRFDRLFWFQGRFLIPNGSPWGAPRRHFAVILETSLPRRVQWAFRASKSAIWDQF